MAIDFTTDINNVTRQIKQYIRQNQPVPKCTIDHYNSLAGATISTQTLESGTNDFPVGSLGSAFPSISTTDSIAVASSASRTYLTIQNIGDETVYIHFGGAAAVDAGLKLLPGAEFTSQVLQLIQAEIHAVTDAATSTLAVYEIA